MSDIDFIAFITFAAEHRSTQALADTLTVSLPTIRRWMNGENLPHMAIREAIITAIRNSEAI